MDDICRTSCKNIRSYNSLKKSLLNDQPKIKLIRKNNTMEMDLKCSSAKEIISFELKMIDEGRPYAIKRIGSYVERINLSNILKIKDAELFPATSLFYHNKKVAYWKRPISYETSFIIFMCRNNEGKYTLLSDIVALKKYTFIRESRPISNIKSTILIYAIIIQ
jgi:hypothetical protein